MSNQKEFNFPAEKLVISFSGGVGSAASAILAWEHKLEFTCVFADTMIEDEDLYRFNADISKLIGKEFIHLKNGMNPWEVYRDVRYIGNNRTAHCSQRLKTDMVRDWMNENSHDATLILGMGIDELERIKRAAINWNPIEVDSLLIRYNMNSYASRTELIQKYGIKLPRLYDLGFPHNNCGGFCCRSGQTQFASLLQHFPDRYQWHVEQEEIAYREIGPTAKGFIRKTVNGQLRYLRMSEFRDMIKSGEITVDPYEYGGCACFVDEVSTQSFAD